ncbi:MAG: acyl carrier protein [Hahellaceae bacterium]|nr:acyl carrier protein [Hahellaceae bacterium]MCP5211742.1 acyl carrier protein [Hahellaceae bacterium]
MSSTSIYEVFAKALALPLSEVSDVLAYNTISQWDSTAHLGLVAEIEETYQILLEMDDILELSSVAKAKEILLRYDVTV